MNVYIEYVLLDNFIIDGLLLIATHLTLRKKIVWWRIVLSALSGAIIVIFTSMVGGWLSYLLKAFCLFAMCIIATGFRGLVKYILIFSAYTALLGGILIAVFYLLQLNFEISAVITYFNGVPFSLYIVAVVLFAVMLFLLVQYLKSARRHNAYTCNVDVKWADKSFNNRTAFLDSGNSLSCQGLPVCFVLADIGKKLRSDIANAVLTKQATVVKYMTMSGTVTTMAIKGFIKHKGIDTEVLLALPCGKKQADYDILLNNIFLEVEDETTTATKTNFR